jgi:polyvinyl alcohol dehydrogenase (cytochrome)
LKNSRYSADEKKISTKTVGGLTLKWSIGTDGDVTANPAVDGDFIYFPDSAGSLYKVTRTTGALVWKKLIGDYTGIAGDFARATPAVAGNALILGNQAGKLSDPKGAVIIAVNKEDGSLLWRTLIDGPIGDADSPGFKQRYSFVTHSAIVADGKAIVGIASNEELIAGFWPKAAGWTWNFRGSIVALDVATGAIEWRTYTVPEGYYGGAVWGSTGAVDVNRKLVFMATGNNYMVPDSVLDCINDGNSPPSCAGPDLRCYPMDGPSDDLRCVERWLRPQCPRCLRSSAKRQLPEPAGPRLGLRPRPDAIR